MPTVPPIHPHHPDRPDEVDEPAAPLPSGRAGTREGEGRLCRAALAAAAAGLYVFPTQPRSKVPADKGWYAAATRDGARIRAWWAARPYNIGVAVGRSGVVVIDLDADPDPDPPPRWAGARDGRDVLARLAREAGASFPGDTFTVATPRDGWHLYFRAPAGVAPRNSAGEVGWRIDVRAGVGQAVAPGSRNTEGRFYRLLRPGPFAELPGWLARLLPTASIPPPSAPVVGVGRGAVGMGSPRIRAYTAAALTRTSGEIAAAAYGTRHHTLLAAARSLGRLVGAGVLDREDAARALAEAASGWIGVHGYTSAQIDRDVADGLAFGAGYPAPLPDPYQ